MKASLALAFLLHAGGVFFLWNAWRAGPSTLDSQPRALELGLVRDARTGSEARPQLPPKPAVPSQVAAAVTSREEAPEGTETSDFENPVTASTTVPFGYFRPALLPPDFKIMYPTEARWGAGAEGTVVLRVEVAESGQVLDVQIVRTSGHSILDRAAAEQLYLTRMIPANANGLPLPSTVEIIVKFQLENSF